MIEDPTAEDEMILVQTAPGQKLGDNYIHQDKSLAPRRSVAIKKDEMTPE